MFPFVILHSIDCVAPTKVVATFEAADCSFYAWSIEEGRRPGNTVDVRNRTGGISWDSVGCSAGVLILWGPRAAVWTANDATPAYQRLSRWTFRWTDSPELSPGGLHESGFHDGAVWAWVLGQRACHAPGL
jgi:hypothetical protein